jgi:hypothetical protein
MAKPIREITGLSPASLTDAILTSTEPLVMRGLVAGWPLVQAALVSPQAGAAYLRRFYRGAKVVAMLGAPDMAGRFFYNAELDGMNFETVYAKLDVVLDELDVHCADLDPPTIYVGSTTVDVVLPEFRSENDLPLGALDPLMSLWIGNRTTIAAHYDLPDNIACVAAGHRRFTLFPPAQLKNLYIGPLDFTPAGQSISLVDIKHPDFEKFPLFGEAERHAQVAELGPGDAIFIPSMWWHHIEALDSFNILLNYWWRQSPPWMDTPSSALMLALMTIRDLPPAQRTAWKELFRHYVFDSDGSESAHIPPRARGSLAPFDLDKAKLMRADLLKKLNR